MGIQGDATIGNWLEKFGNFDRKYELERKKMKSPTQQILELQQQIHSITRLQRR